MKKPQIELVHKLADENLITLNGIKAHAYPCKDGVLIDNNPLQEPTIDCEDMVVDYPTFIKTVRNNDGCFKNRNNKLNL